MSLWSVVTICHHHASVIVDDNVDRSFIVVVHVLLVGGRGDGLCWLTWAGTDPGRVMMLCVVTIVLFVIQLIVHCSWSGCHIADSDVAPGFVVRRGRGRTPASLPGWHRPWRVMVLCVVIIVLFVI